MIDALLLAAAAPALVPPLAPLAPLVGHCWAAALPGGQTDTHCFELMYDGRFVRDRHVVTGGGARYEGETVYGVEGGAVAYTYWASDGETLRGAMRGDGRHLDFAETVTPGPGGATLRLKVDWTLDESGYTVRWASNDPRFTRTMRYARVDAPPAR